MSSLLGSQRGPQMLQGARGSDGSTPWVNALAEGGTLAAMAALTSHSVDNSCRDNDSGWNQGPGVLGMATDMGLLESGMQNDVLRGLANNLFDASEDDGGSEDDEYSSGESS